MEKKEGKERERKESRKDEKRERTSVHRKCTAANLAHASSTFSVMPRSVRMLRLALLSVEDASLFQKDFRLISARCAVRGCSDTIVMVVLAEMKSTSGEDSFQFSDRASKSQLIEYRKVELCDEAWSIV
mmetsp:Transcript_14920/g.28982  ORF Transcript_14920/g.28982 Transcript_14920/m.28982 type:complete len:129 (-) Transcript_14920:1037-1423(-)